MVLRGIALLVWLLGRTGAVQAAEGIAAPQSWLQWSSSEADGSCGDPSEFAAQVETRLGRSPAAAATELDVSVGVRVERLPGPPPRWTGELRVHGRDGAPDGVRTIDRAGESCQPVTAILALMAALVLQPSTEKAPAGPAAVVRPPPIQRQVDAAGPEETVSAVGRNGSARPWTISVALGPALAVGLLPDPSLSAQAAVAISGSRGAGFVVSAGSSTKQDRFINASQGATLSRRAVELAGCWPASRGSSRALALCGGTELGRLRAVGFGFDLSTTQERWSIDLAAGAELRQRLVGPLFAAMGAELLIPLQRDRIAYTDPSGRAEQIFTTAPLAGSGRIFIGVAFR